MQWQDGSDVSTWDEESVEPTRPKCTVISEQSPVPTASPGKASIVGFGVDGVVTLLSAKIRPSVQEFGYRAGGWRVDRHVRLLGATTRRGAADIIGFDDGCVFVSANTGDGTFGPPTLVHRDFTYATGWRVDKHPRFVADLRGTGLVDLVGFGEDGVCVALNDGHGGFGPLRVALHNFGWKDGWRVGRHLRFLAPVTRAAGEGPLDVIGFGEDKVFVARGAEDGTFGHVVPVLDNFCINAGGWNVDQHPRVLADLTGDGRVDIVGFAYSGVLVALNNGAGGFHGPSFKLSQFGLNQGWRVDRHPRFVADLTGDGRGDIVGFGEDGVWIALNDGAGGFRQPELAVRDFGYVAGGWRVEKHLRFVADLTGNGCADIIGFGDTGVWVAYNDGTGHFRPMQKLTDSFGSNGGQWDLDKTVRYVANL